MVMALVLSYCVVMAVLRKIVFPRYEFFVRLKLASQLKVEVSLFNTALIWELSICFIFTAHWQCSSSTRRCLAQRRGCCHWLFSLAFHFLCIMRDQVRRCAVSR